LSIFYRIAVLIFISSFLSGAAEPLQGAPYKLPMMMMMMMMMMWMMMMMMMIKYAKFSYVTLRCSCETVILSDSTLPALSFATI